MEMDFGPPSNCKVKSLNLDLTHNPRKRRSLSVFFFFLIGKGSFPQVPSFFYESFQNGVDTGIAFKKDFPTSSPLQIGAIFSETVGENQNHFFMSCTFMADFQIQKKEPVG